ncbi:MAG: UbiA family prenyltransferase [Limisphaerales bacterium]
MPCGWWLSGGGNYWKLPFLFIGVSALYTGGMFLNDAFDADFDRQRRASRPIPSGAISVESVWRWSFALLGVGAVSLVVLGVATGVMAVALLLCIIITTRRTSDHGVAVADGLVPVLGLCHRGFRRVCGA